MMAVTAGRVMISKRLQKPRRTKKESETGATIMPRQHAQEAKPGNETNGIFDRLAIQKPRPSDIKRPNPERLVGRARCQSAAPSTLIPMTCAFVRTPAVTPLSAEKTQWQK